MYRRLEVEKAKRKRRDWGAWAWALKLLNFQGPIHWLLCVTEGQPRGGGRVTVTVTAMFTYLGSTLFVPSIARN